MRIFRRSLWDERMSLLSWIAVLAIFVVYAVSSFQSFGHSEALKGLMENLPAYMRAMFGGLDWGTIDGWINTEIFSWISLLIAFYAGLYGASALAREADSHTMESLLAQPVRRWSVVLQKFGALFVATLVLNFAVLGAVLVSLRIYFPREPASTHAYLLVTVASFLASLAAGGLALFISALVNEQRRATVYASGLIILLYFVNVIGQMSRKANFLSTFNPFGRYHSADIILTGRIAAADAAFLVGFALVFLAATVFWFERKDLT